MSRGRAAAQDNGRLRRNHIPHRVAEFVVQLGPPCERQADHVVPLFLFSQRTLNIAPGVSLTTGPAYKPRTTVWSGQSLARCRLTDCKSTGCVS